MGAIDGDDEAESFPEKEAAPSAIDDAPLGPKAFGVEHARVGQEDLFAWNALHRADLHREFIEHLSPMRRHGAAILSSAAFETTLCLVLLTNLVIAILETNATAEEDEEVPQWILSANIVLLVVYCCEILMRVYVYHSYYFKSSWNWLDIVVVGLDLVLQILGGVIGNLPNLSVLRTVRLLRLARAMRVLILFPELHTMIRGLAGTIKTVFWGILLLTGFMLFFSLIAVQIIHPINKTIEYEGCWRCPHAFESVWEANLTFLQQIVAGDSWGQVTVPIIEEAPWTMVFFLLVLVTIDLLVINLILAVVVEKAQQAHADETQEVVRQQVLEKEAQTKQAQRELVKICYSMDEDKSGNLTLDELLMGFDRDEYFQNMLKSMDISRDDIRMVFNILDQDSSGDIDYVEFVDQLHRLKSQDTHTLLIFILHYVKELQVIMTAPERRRAQQISLSKGPAAGGSSSSTSLGLPAAKTLSAGPQRSRPLSAEERRKEKAHLNCMVELAQRTCSQQNVLLGHISEAFARIAKASAQEVLCWNTPISGCLEDAEWQRMIPV